MSYSHHPGTAQQDLPVERDEVSIPMLALVGALIAVVVVLIAILLQAWFYAGKAELTAERTLPATDPQTPLGQALLEQQAQINSYRWLNREAGTRAIPIQRAMEVVVREMAVEQDSAKGGGQP
ncbi:MAG: hypothetical protein ABR915_19740 [Thermoguttaceae bacterium]|jgi:CHASE1-domain containing sensor protein